MNSSFIQLPAEFNNDRIFLCPITHSGHVMTFYTDTGGGGMFIDPQAATQLNLELVRRELDGDTEHLYVSFPQFRDEAVIPKGTHCDELMVFPDIPFEMQAFLGQSWFVDRVWKIDYLQREMGFSHKDTQYDTDGFQSCAVGFRTGECGNGTFCFPRIQTTIDGEVYDFLFDTGATVSLTNGAMEFFNDGGPALRGTSFITQSVFQNWRSRHTDWTVVEQADALGNQPMIQVPIIEVAGIKAGPVWFTCRPDPNFHEYISQWMDKPVEGALGGSVFKYFSIIIDYPKWIAYFKR